MPLIKSQTAYRHTTPAPSDSHRLPVICNAGVQLLPTSRLFPEKFPKTAPCVRRARTKRALAAECTSGTERFAATLARRVHPSHAPLLLSSGWPLRTSPHRHNYKPLNLVPTQLYPAAHKDNRSNRTQAGHKFAVPFFPDPPVSATSSRPWLACARRRPPAAFASHAACWPHPLPRRLHRLSRQRTPRAGCGRLRSTKTVPKHDLLPNRPKTPEMTKQVSNHVVCNI